MSFSKAGIKRFNDSKGCAPPVGAYDPKDLNKKKAATLGALKSERFKAPKDITPGPGTFNVSTASFGTPSKKGAFDISIRTNERNPVCKLSCSSSSSVESLNSRKGQDTENNHIDKGTCERCQQLMEQSKNSRDWVQSLQKCRDSLAAQKVRLQGKLRELEQETWEKEDTIRFLKGEVSAVTDHMLQGQQTLFEANAEIAEYKEKIEQLEEEELTVNANIKALSEKYQLIEKQLAEEQSCGNKRESELKSRLDVAHAELVQVSEQCEGLQVKNKQLLQTLNKEKEEIERLVYQIDEQTRTASDLGTVLEDKEETITNLEIQLEATKIELQNTKEMTENNQKVIQGLQDQITALQVTENQLQDQLQQESNMNKQTARNHADRILELEQTELALKEENECKGKDLISAVSKCEQLEEQVAQLTSEVNTMEEEFNGTISHIKNTKEKELAEMKDVIEKLNKEKVILEKQVTEKTEDIQTLEDKVKLLHVENESVETKMHETETNLKNIIKDNSKTVEVINQKLTTSCEERVELLKKLEQVTYHKERFEQMVEILEQKVVEVESNAHNKELEWRDDFQRLTMELQEITEERDILQQKISNMSAEKTSLYEHVQSTNDQLCKQKDLVDKLSKDVESLSLEKSEVEKKLDNMSTNCRSLHNENDHLMNEIDYLKRSNAHLKNQEDQIDQLQLTVKSIREENSRLVKELESTEEMYKKQLETLQQQLADSTSRQELDELAAECSKWQKLYDDLQAKVEPFMEQLDAFELEKQSLLGRSKNAQAEVDKLSKEYARLLGHQNQKQKIHHIIKIKEENNALKVETSSLREQINKQKRTIRKLEDKLSALEGKKRFDPSKSFLHAKENAAPPSPLKDGNRFTAH